MRKHPPIILIKIHTNESKKDNSTKLQFFTESGMDRMKVEIERVSQLYKANRIDGIRGHEMLHQGTKDLQDIYWKVSAMIGAEHRRINFLHQVKKSMSRPLNEKEYFSKPTIEALDNFALASKFQKSGLSEIAILKKMADTARRLVRMDARILRQEIRQVVRDARKVNPVEISAEQLPDHVFFEGEYILSGDAPERINAMKEAERTKFESMEVRKITRP